LELFEDGEMVGRFLCEGQTAISDLHSTDMMDIGQWWTLCGVATRHLCYRHSFNLLLLNLLMKSISFL